MADAIYRDGENRPQLSLASAVYPGLDCDESSLIDAVVQKVSFKSEQWNGVAAVGLEPELHTAAHPWGGGVPASGDSDFQIAQRKGARVILSGLGGDELLFERGVFRDLAAQGRWLTLWHQTALAPNYATHNQWYFLRDAVRGACPELLRRLWRFFRPHHAEPPPAWLGPELRPLWKDNPPTAPQIESDSCSSHTQRYTWKWLTGPRLLWTTEVQVLQAAYRGMEMRFPYLDGQLAQFVLAIPFKYRLPGGRMKLLLREAMCDLLPPPIAGRQGVTTFTSNARFQLREELPRLRALVNDKNWHSEPYVCQRGAQRLVEQLEATSPADQQQWSGVRKLSEIALLECWLRRLR
jgi:asparagine synthetase B (glutamine-hydrolysing)